MHSVEGRAQACQFLLPALVRLPDKIERAAVANDIAGYLGVESGLVLEQFRKAAAARRETKIAAAAQEVPQAERILLRCLLESEPARRAVLARLEASPARETLAARPVFQALLALGERLNYAALEARLEERDKSLLAASVFADEGNEDQISAEQALACLDKLEASHRKVGRDALKARIREAERAGDLSEALRLNRELMEMGSGGNYQSDQVV
jgi:DNA primase